MSKNIIQRINDVRKKIDYIKKDKSVSTGNSSYKAVTHDQVTAMVRDHLVSAGVVIYPVFVSSSMNPPGLDKEGNPGKQWRYEAVYDFTAVNEDDRTDSITMRIEAHATDNADKAPGKALSYAKKYALLKLLDIESGEDEESRYQSNESMSEDRIELHIMKIKGSEGDAKKAAYKLAIQECVAINDVDSANRIKAAVSPEEKK